MQQNPAKCPVCGTKISQPQIESYQKWDLYGCGNCSFHFWLPFKHPGKEFYENAYEPNAMDNLGWGNKEFIKNPVGAGNLLDIGCCCGDFLNAFKKEGRNLFGIDISAKSVSVAKDLFGLENVYAETVDVFVERKDVPRFNVVTFFELIEHLDNPVEFIENVKKLLEDGGYVALSTPDRNCLPGYRDTPPQHIAQWDEKSLRYLLETHGFKVVKIVREPISWKYFAYIFFKKTGVSLISFGITSKIKKYLNKTKRVAGQEFSHGKQAAILKVVNVGYKLKQYLFGILVFPAVFIGKIMGFKWQSIYVVAKLSRE